MTDQDGDHESRISLESRKESPEESVDPAPSSGAGESDHDPDPGTTDHPVAPGLGRPRSTSWIAGWRPGVLAMLLIGLIGGLALAGLAALCWVLFSHDGGPSGKLPASYSAGFVTYHDPAGHFTISYPHTWTRVPDSTGALVLAIGGENALSVRRFPLQQSVNPSDLADMRSVTDAILSTPSAHLTVLADQPITVNGVTGLYYLYYFPNGGSEGVHAHYFLFQGHALYTMVFQVVPTANFQKFANTFDAVAKSFQVDTK